MRPSFLNAFSAVIDAAAATPEAFLRDLVVRNLPVVAVGREARMYSMHAVLVDAALGAARVGRDLLLAGHRKFAAVEAPGSNALAQALRQTAARLAPDATVDTFSPEDAARLAAAARRRSCATRPRRRAGSAPRSPGPPRPPATPGLDAAAPRCRRAWPWRRSASRGREVPCSGYYVDGGKIAEQVISLLRDPPAGRPATLWMAGEFADRGTVGGRRRRRCAGHAGSTLGARTACSSRSTPDHSQQHAGRPASDGPPFSCALPARMHRTAVAAPAELNRISGSSVATLYHDAGGVKCVHDPGRRRPPVTREPLAKLLRYEGFETAVRRQRRRGARRARPAPRRTSSCST